MHECGGCGGGVGVALQEGMVFFRLGHLLDIPFKDSLVG